MLLGSKCYLRPLTYDDVESLNKWNSNETLNMYLGNGFSPISIDLQKEWIKNMIDTSKLSNSKRYMICDLESKRIGLIGLYNINYINQNCEIGLYIGEERYKSKGIGTEAYFILENYILDYLNFNKIKLFVVKDNENAVNFWSKMGYSHVGTLFRERFIKAEFRDVYIMEKIINKGDRHD